MNKDLKAYLKLKLDVTRFANQYVVLIDGKLFDTGSNLPKLLKRAKKKYPAQTPTVTKIPGPQTLVLTINVSH